jgi:tetratricopeptide (TPR) repeat protein
VKWERQGLYGPDDEETWDESELHRVLRPLEIRLSIQPAPAEKEPELRQSARSLLAELLELPVEERRWKLGDRRFHSPELLELLLEEGHGSLPFDLDRAGDLTLLASELGMRLPRTGGPEEDAGVSRAFLLMGTTRRLLGDVAVADAALQRAGQFARTDTERGLFCRALALARWDQGRMEEALALLQQAGQRFAGAPDFQEIAVCRALLGLLHLDEGRLSNAASCLAQACQDLDGERRPWLAALAWLGVALCWAAGERPRKARAARQTAWGFYDGVKEDRALSWLRWLEGKGAHLLGETEEAGALLGEVRRAMIERRYLPEAALATLDLALVRLDAGRGSEVGGLVEEIAATFAGSLGLGLALDVLAQPGMDAVAGRLSPKAWAAMAPILRLAFRLQGVPLQPVPFA